MVNLAIAGVAGRMGRAFVKGALADSHFKLVGGSVRPGSEYLNQDLGELVGAKPIGVKSSDDVSVAFKDADVVIDFTLPEVAIQNLDFYQTHQIKVVLGGTGFSQDQLKAITAASKNIAMVHAPNMSIGVNLCMKLSELAAKVLDDFDVEIIEAHHRNKVDAPSGTALAFGQTIADAKSQTFDEVKQLNRHDLKQARPDNEIGFATVRGGDIFGEHTIMFAGLNERVEITHRAGSRDAFALGALKAASWLKAKKQGLFNMMDVLGL